MKYKRFVQGLLSETEFRTYILTSLTKRDLVNIILAGAKGLRKRVAIDEPLDVEC